VNCLVEMPPDWDGAFTIVGLGDEPIVVFADLPIDARSDFDAFFVGQAEAFIGWFCEELPSSAAGKGLDRAAMDAIFAFTWACAEKARQLGHQGWSQGEVLCRLMVEPLVARVVAWERRAGAGAATIAQEARSVARDGLRSRAEAEVEARARASFVPRACKGRLAEELSSALARPLFHYGSPYGGAVGPRPPRTGPRGRQSRRRPNTRGKAGSRGDPAPGEDDLDDEHGSSLIGRKG
jgi:hypothetical protein